MDYSKIFVTCDQDKYYVANMQSHTYFKIYSFKVYAITSNDCINSLFSSLVSLSFAVFSDIFQLFAWYS